MAQQQHAADVHPDELYPPNKRCDLMDANKKVDLEQVQCPPESKILTNIIKNHPLRFNIAAYSSVPWIYMAQFWHTFKEDGSKYRLTFMLDKKKLSLTLDDFRTIFHIPQPWQTLCKIFSKCLTTCVTGWDQPPLHIIQMMYCFVNNIHLDYAELLWDGTLLFSSSSNISLIAYPDLPKIIISHYYDYFPDISRCARDMIYAGVFGLDIPWTQSQPTESPKERRGNLGLGSPNTKMDAESSSAQNGLLREEQKAREYVELVTETWQSEDIEKMMAGSAECY
ncbi:hypothetical protein Tco_1148863 [Tanacetum coccineum]